MGLLLDLGPEIDGRAILFGFTLVETYNRNPNEISDKI